MTGAINGPGDRSLPAGAFAPHHELAARLDAYVDLLLSVVPSEERVKADSTQVELLVGLASGADALRALHQDDPGFAHHAEIAVRALAKVSPDDHATSCGINGRPDEDHRAG